MTTCLFRSSLAFRLQTFAEMRSSLGRRSIMGQKILRYLDCFLMDKLKPGQTITRDIAESWIKSMDHLSIGTRINRMSVLRQFCRYLSHFDSRTCVISSSSFPHRTRPTPYIYTRTQIRSVMAAAKKVGPPQSFRPMIFSTVIGLLYSTGLRISEAMKLTLEDVDLKRCVLTIRETKFKKSRYVPISSSAAKALADFLDKRQRVGYSTDPETPVFINANTGRAYGTVQICQLFLEVLRRLKLRGPKGERGPRLHDLRHSFAVQRLLAWYRQGADLPAKLPLLTTYLGHTSVIYTEVYLQATAELLEEAGKRFRNYCSIPVSRKGVSHAQ